MNLKGVAKGLTPPFFWDGLRHVFRKANKPSGGSSFFQGDYVTWEEAVRASSGYASPDILRQTRAATLKARENDQLFERDSVLLDRPEYPFPVIAALLRASQRSEGALSVVDFGGSLGSSYYQCRKFLQDASPLEWSVIEQPAHVACGRAEFASETLKFYESAEECLKCQSPHVLLLSGVLQYLPAPRLILEHLLQNRFCYVIVDRTAFGHATTARLTVQHVPREIYGASYPAWFFNEAEFRSWIPSRYELFVEFAGSDEVTLEDGTSYFKGFCWDLKRD